MKKQALLAVVVAATVFQTNTPAFASNGQEIVGNIVGGIIGGAIGSQVGGGSGNKIATVVGATVGATVGGQVARGPEYDRYPPGRPGHGPVRPGRPGRPGRPEYPPGRPGPGYPPGRPGPGPGYPPPPPPNYGQYQGVAQINGISRRPGGQWYRLNLQRPLSITQLEVRVLRAAIRIYEASIVTDYNQRIPLYELTNTQVIPAGYTAGAYINRNDRIVAIDIRAESFGDFADVLATVTSREGYPSIIVTQF